MKRNHWEQAFQLLFRLLHKSADFSTPLTEGAPHKRNLDNLILHRFVKNDFRSLHTNIPSLCRRHTIYNKVKRHFIRSELYWSGFIFGIELYVYDWCQLIFGRERIPMTNCCVNSILFVIIRRYSE